jgi:hypothetical protein
MQPPADAPATDASVAGAAGSEVDTYIDSDAPPPSAGPVVPAQPTPGQATERKSTDRAPADGEPAARAPTEREAPEREPAGFVPAEPRLSEREERILAFERQWWRHAGAKEQAIRDTFQLSATRYYQVLNALLDNPAALAADPVLVRRLRRLRTTRARSRRR